MAIRRPPTTFSDTISTADIADDAVTSAKLDTNLSVAGTLGVTGAFTASGGIANSGTITAGTLGSSVVFPHGVQTETNYLTEQINTPHSGNTKGFYPSAGNNIVVGFNSIKDNFGSGSGYTYTQNILSVSSGYFTLNTGYYHWFFFATAYGTEHAVCQGLRTYGGSDGTGSTLGNITTENVSFGMAGTTYNKNGYGTGTLQAAGLVKVSSNTQKYCVTNFIENSTYAGNSSGTLPSSTANQIQAYIRLDKIGSI